MSLAFPSHYSIYVVGFFRSSLLNNDELKLCIRKTQKVNNYLKDWLWLWFLFVDWEHHNRHLRRGPVRKSTQIYFYKSKMCMTKGNFDKHSARGGCLWKRWEPSNVFKRPFKKNIKKICVLVWRIYFPVFNVVSSELVKFVRVALSLDLVIEFSRISIILRSRPRSPTRKRNLCTSPPFTVAYVTQKLLFQDWKASSSR